MTNRQHRRCHDLGAVRASPPSSAAWPRAAARFPRSLNVGSRRSSSSCSWSRMGFLLHPVVELGYTRRGCSLIGVYILHRVGCSRWILLQPRDYLSSYLLLRHDRARRGRHRRRRASRAAASDLADPRVHRLLCGHGGGRPDDGAGDHERRRRRGEQGGTGRLPLPGAVRHHRLRRHLGLP